MPERYWTVEEANAALERVTAVVEQARDAVAQLSVAAEARTERAKSNGHGGVADDADDARERAVFAAAVDELARDGIVLRDLEQGLVDFPARAPSGRDYWLCWLVGEPDVAWWHWPEDGFAGRTPLDQPPA